MGEGEVIWDPGGGYHVGPWESERGCGGRADVGPWEMEERG